MSSAIALLGLTACAANGSNPAAGSSAMAPGSAGSELAGSGAMPRIAPFDGVTLVATGVNGTHTIVPGSTITLTFESGSLSARAGCNYLSGPYTVTGNVLSAPQMATTAMGCGSGLMAQDTWLTAFLASSPTWTEDDGTITLTNGTDTIAMTKAPGGAEVLEATGWKLVVLISAGTYEPVDQGVKAWVRFSGREVAFDSSCNRGVGSAETTDETITFGTLSRTKIACGGVSGETERAMTAVMVGTTSYRLEDPSNSTLTITSQDGANALQFTADPIAGADAFAGTSGPPSAGVAALPTS